MRRLRYSLRAQRDLLQIRRYITVRSESKEVAANFIAKLRGQCRKLSQLPGLMGRARPEYDERLRSFPYGNYIIFFQYRDDLFEVVAIIERHRDIAAQFEEDP